MNKRRAIKRIMALIEGGKRNDAAYLLDMEHEKGVSNLQAVKNIANFLWPFVVVSVNNKRVMASAIKMAKERPRG